MAITLQELLVKVGMDISDYSAGIDKLAQEGITLDTALKKVGTSTDTLTQGLDKLGSSLSRIGTTMTAAVTLPILGVGVAALKMSSDLQQATIAFTTMLGSATKAQAHLEQLRDFAMKTPFEFNDLVTASKRLQALGFTAQQIIPTLTAVGDAAAALGSGAEGINRITLALGQMQAKGKVSAEEMRQLAEAGIPAWQILADALTKAQGKVVTVGEAMKMAEKGMIEGVGAVQVLLDGMEGKFKGLMGNQMQTIGGMFSNLKDQSAKVLVDIGDALTPLGKKVLEFGTGSLTSIQKLVGAFREMPIALQGVAVGLTAVAVAAGPVLFLTGQMVQSISAIMKVGTALSTMAGGTSALLAFAGSVGAVATAIMALVAAQAAIAKFANSANPAIAGLAGGINAGLSAAGLPMLPGQNLAASEQDKLDAWHKANLAGQTFGTKAPATGAPGLIRVDPEAGKKAQEDAASLLGLTDLQANMKAYEAAYAKVAASGKYTTEQLKSAWEKVQNAIDAATASVQAFSKYQDAKAFNLDSLPSLDSQIRTGAAALVAAGSFKALKEAIQSAKEQMAAMIEEENHFRENGLDPSKIKAGLLGNESVSAFQGDFTTIAQMQALKEAAVELDKQFASMANPFGAMNADAAKFIENLQQGVAATKRMELAADPLHKAFAALGLEFNTATGEMESRAIGAFDLIAQSAGSSLVGVENAWAKVNGQVRALARTNLPEAVRLESEYIAALQAKGAAIGDIYAEQEKLLALEIQIKVNRGESANADAVDLINLQAKNDAMREQATLFADLYGSIGKDLSRAWGELGKGFADAILSGENFGKVMTGVFRQLEKQILEDVVGTAFKALKDALLANTGLLGGLGKGLSGILGGGASAAGGAASAGAGAASAAGGVASGAGGVASTAGGAASSAAGAAGSLASVANIANIANAGISLVSGIVQGFQLSHISSDMQKTEENTRYLKIGLVTQGDSLLNDTHMIRNHLTDFFAAHVNFGVLIDLVKELTDEKGTAAQIRDFLYNPIGPLLQQLAGGGISGAVNPDGTMTVSGGAFESVVSAVKDGSKSIVDAITAAVKSIAALSGYTGARGSFVNQDPTVASRLTGVEDVGGTTRTTGVGSSLKPPAQPVAETQPYNNGIPYDTATTTFQTVIPANQNVVNTLMLVNQSITQGFSSVVAQLQSMTGIGGGTGTGSAPATGADVQNAVNKLLDSGASPQAVIDQLIAMGGTLVDSAGTLRTATGAAYTVSDNLRSVTEWTREIAADVADAAGTFRTATGAAYTVRPDGRATTSSVGSFEDFLTGAQQDAAGTFRTATGAAYTANPNGDRAQQVGDGFFNLLTPNDPRNNPAASMYTIPLPKLDGSWNPVTYVPAPNTMQAARGNTVNIINPVFRDPRDAQHIVDLVRNQL